MSELLEAIFGGDVPKQPLLLHQCAARAIVVYLLGIALLRVGKSRIISRVTTVDVLLGFILGSLLSRGITGHASMSGTAISSAAIVAAHFAVTYATLRGGFWETLIKGHSRVLVENGQLVDDNLRKSNLSQEDLLEELRLNGVDSLDKVKSARKERNGQVSVIKQQG
jgi:uncharacterized membrane protein YcaP (DUF421 family)